MPRQARLDAPGTLHHIIARGIERRAIFLGEADYENFLRRLEAAVSWGGALVFAWALMPNHLHLLLRTGEARLPSVMRRVMTGYAVTFNLRHNRHGHVFQNRYKSIVCEEESYLLELVRYIHLNPVRAGVVGSVAGLESFPYSGHAALMGRIERPWQAVGEILERFGRTVDEGRRGYEQFVRDGSEQGRRPDLVGGGLRRSCGAWMERQGRRRGDEDEAPAYDERVLGSSDFVQDVLADADWERRQALQTAQVSLAELVERVVALTEISEQELRSGVKRPVVVAVRRAFIHLAVREFGHSGAAVARYLGVVASTVNRQAAREDRTPLAERLREKLTRGIA
jgi:putative transposase